MTMLEAIARAVCCGDAACYHASSGCPCVATTDPAAGRASPIETALAILAALREAGYGVVPIAPDQRAMVRRVVESECFVAEPRHVR
jgi:hypothetical protein